MIWGDIVRKVIFIVISVTIIFISGCVSTDPTLKGFYQSARVSNYHIQLSIDDDSFVEYIDNREVDSGIYEKIEDRIYELKSSKQNFQIILDDDNSFDIIIEKLNDGKPILMKKLGNIPTTFSTEFDDVEEYRALLGNSEGSEGHLGVLNLIAKRKFFIKGESISDADYESIVKFGKSFINLFNGAVAEQEKVSFVNYIANDNLLKFTDKMLELTQLQDLQGSNGVNYGFKNEFINTKVQYIKDNLAYLELQFEFEGSGMGCKMLITSENRSLKLVDLYFGSKDGVDTFATGHLAKREVNDPNVWLNEDWVKSVFDKLNEYEEKLIP